MVTQNETKVNSKPAKNTASLGLLLDDELTSYEMIESWIPEDWQVLREKLLDESCEVSLEVITFPLWAESSRHHLFELVIELNCPLELNGQKFQDPFELALLEMVGLSDLKRHKRGLECAIQTAAFFHADASKGAAIKINERLKQLGVAKEHFQSLVSKIKNGGFQSLQQKEYRTA